MNRNLRLKIEESIETRTVSENLCFLCLACLNDKITYSKQKLIELENQRRIIAAIAINNGVDKKVLQDNILKISKNDYPTFKTITAVSKLIKNNDLSFVSGFIPDRMIHYKSDNELLEDAKRIIPEKQASIPEAEEYIQLCDWIKKYLDITITDTIEKTLISFGESRKCKVVFQCCLWNQKSIIDSVRRKIPFESEYAKFKYFLGIVKNHISQTEENMEKQKKQDEQFWIDNAQVIINGDETLESMIFLQCKDTDSVYYGKHEYVREELEKAIEKLKKQRF